MPIIIIIIIIEAEQTAISTTGASLGGRITTIAEAPFSSKLRNSCAVNSDDCTRTQRLHDGNP
jgi:hypothetical protein